MLFALGSFIIAIGALAEMYFAADSLRISTTVAAIISIAVNAWRPSSDDSARWPGFVKSVAALVVLGAIILQGLPRLLELADSKAGSVFRGIEGKVNGTVNQANQAPKKRTTPERQASSAK